MLVENRQFEPTPPLFGVPMGPKGVTPLEFRQYFGIIKLESLDYRMTLFALSVLVQCRLVTDRQTDTRR